MPIAPAAGEIATPASPLAPGAPSTASAPVAPAGPVVPAASAVVGAPTSPVVPIPTLAQMPNAPLPISPAGFAPPIDKLPPPVVVPTAPAPTPAPITSTAPTEAAVVPKTTATPAPASSPAATTHAPIHPSKPAIFPLPATPTPAPSPAVLPTPTSLQPPAVEPAPSLGSIVNPPVCSPGPGADGTPLNDYWRHGLRFESADKDFSIFIGGRFQFDVVGYLASTGMRQSIPGNVPLEDGVTFRRFRFDMGGTLYKNMEYYAQIDFFNGFVTDISENRLSNVPAPTDLWLQFKDLPVIGNVRVGNQKQLYGFEHLTSSRFLNFLERSLPFDAFVENFDNGFAPGITVFDTFANKRGTWGVGLFKNARTIFGWDVGRNEAEVNGRLTVLPVYAEDGRYLIHMGVGGAFRDLDDGQQRHRARLDARNSPSAFSPLIADTGLYFGSQQQLLVPEFVVVAGPWSFQSEYYGSWVQRAAVPVAGGGFDTMGTVYMQGAYGEVHYFLTGEHRPYSRETGAFTRVIPRRPLAWNRCGFTGCGAWQLAARYTYLDLIDKGINGGRIHDMTLGLNWFLNPNMKVQWNYFLAHRNVANPAGDGFIQGFATRVAIDF
jgi:phosphate-selective porin OprO and OprP